MRSDRYGWIIRSIAVSLASFAIDSDPGALHTEHMKRTNLVLDEHVLEEAKAATGSKTYSDAVNLALRELVRARRFAKVDQFANSDVWQGDLTLMRGDHVSD